MGKKSYNIILFSSLIAIVSFIFMLFNFANDKIFLTEVIVTHLFIILGIYVLFSIYWKKVESPILSYGFFSLFLINSVIVFFNSVPNLWFPIIIAASILGMTESLYLFDEFYPRKPIAVKKLKQKYEKIAEELKDISVEKPKIIVEKHGAEERIDPEELFARIKKRADEIKRASKMARLQRELKTEKPEKKSDKKTKRKPAKKKLNFYDLKAKKRFSTNKYTLKTIKNRRFAVAKAPSGAKSYRLVPSEKKSKAKSKTKNKTKNKTKPQAKKKTTRKPKSKTSKTKVKSAKKTKSKKNTKTKSKSKTKSKKKKSKK